MGVTTQHQQNPIPPTQPGQPTGLEGLEYVTTQYEVEQNIIPPTQSAQSTASESVTSQQQVNSILCYLLNQLKWI